jgi:hypothetical protein
VFHFSRVIDEDKHENIARLKLLVCHADIGHLNPASYSLFTFSLPSSRWVSGLVFFF